MTIETSKINEKGKITIPKEIREKLGIVQGDELIIDVKGNDIIIRKSETEQVSDILDNQEPWKSDSVEFQRKLREEWK